MKEFDYSFQALLAWAFRESLLPEDIPIPVPEIVAAFENRFMLKTFPARRQGRLAEIRTAHLWGHHELLGKLERGPKESLLAQNFSGTGGGASTFSQHDLSKVMRAYDFRLCVDASSLMLVRTAAKAANLLKPIRFY